MSESSVPWVLYFADLSKVTCVLACFNDGSTCGMTMGMIEKVFEHCDRARVESFHRNPNKLFWNASPPTTGNGVGLLLANLFLIAGTVLTPF
jgi:hypothetical protein